MKLLFLVREACDYSDAPALTFENHLGSFVLDKGQLEVTSPASVEEREWPAAVEAFLKAWRLEGEIRRGLPSPTFDPPTAEAYAEQHRRWEEQSREDLVITFDYPPPPSIKVTAEVDNLWERWHRGRLNLRETVPSCAYYCLTVAERLAGGRKQASEKFGIEVKVLRQLGELVSTRGGPATARKATASLSAALTSSEVRWIDEVIRGLILRIGLRAAGVTFPTLTPEDLPDISQTTSYQINVGPSE